VRDVNGIAHTKIEVEGIKILLRSKPHLEKLLNRKRIMVLG